MGAAEQHEVNQANGPGAEQLAFVRDVLGRLTLAAVGITEQVPLKGADMVVCLSDITGISHVRVQDDGFAPNMDPDILPPLLYSSTDEYYINPDNENAVAAAEDKIIIIGARKFTRDELGNAINVWRARRSEQNGAIEECSANYFEMTAQPFKEAIATGLKAIWEQRQAQAPPLTA